MVLRLRLRVSLIESAVVFCPFGWVGENFVGFMNLDEHLTRDLRMVSVGVILKDQLSKSGYDLVVSCCPFHTKSSIVVFHINST